MPQRAGARRVPWVELEGSEADLWRPPGRRAPNKKRQQMDFTSPNLGSVQVCFVSGESRCLVWPFASGAAAASPATGLLLLPQVRHHLASPAIAQHLEEVRVLAEVGTASHTGHTAPVIDSIPRFIFFRGT